MIADVVAWLPQDELPFDELHEACQFVIEEQFNPIKNPDRPEVYFTPVTIKATKMVQVKKLMAGGHDLLFAVVVSDEPLTTERALEVYETYQRQLEEADERGDGRSDRQSPTETAEPDPREMGETERRTWTSTESMVDDRLVAFPDT